MAPDDNTRLRPMPGRFIVIDGPDYCGKGTQHRMLVDYLLDHPLDRDRKLINVFATREPYNTAMTLEIRELLQKLSGVKDAARQLAELFTADRFEHASVFSQARKGNAIVVSDRYKYSTLAYQNLQGVPLDELLLMHAGLPVPDLTIFVMTSITERLRRKAAVRERPYAEVFEKDNAFQERLQHKYLELRDVLADEPIVLVDGDRSIGEIQAEIRAHVDALLFPPPRD